MHFPVRRANACIFSLKLTACKYLLGPIVAIQEQPQLSIGIPFRELRRVFDTFGEHLAPLLDKGLVGSGMIHVRLKASYSQFNDLSCSSSKSVWPLYLKVWKWAKVTFAEIFAFHGASGNTAISRLGISPQGALSRTYCSRPTNWYIPRRVRIGSRRLANLRTVQRLRNLAAPEMRQRPIR
jgi:hypothetical protein